MLPARLVRLPALRLLPSVRLRAPRPLAAPSPHRRRRLVALALVTAALGTAYMLWLRNSSLVRVERVQVVGLSTAPGADRLRAELTARARGMTTLHVDADALRRIVAGDPVVRALAVRPNFPHGLTIDVTENRPVASVSVGGRSVPVAADGTVLEGVDMNGSLPVVRTVALPSGRHVQPGNVLDRVTVAAAAPPALLPRIATISIQPGKGYVAQLENGPAVWLGSSDELTLKWETAAAVLAQRSSQGASYVDVRMPQRAVAGGLAVDSASQPDATAPQPGTGGPDPIPADPGAAPPTATQGTATTPAAPQAGATTSTTPSTTPQTAPANPQP